MACSCNCPAARVATPVLLLCLLRLGIWTMRSAYSPLVAVAGVWVCTLLMWPALSSPTQTWTQRHGSGAPACKDECNCAMIVPLLVVVSCHVNILCSCARAVVSSASCSVHGQGTGKPRPVSPCAHAHSHLLCCLHLLLADTWCSV